MEIHLKNNLKNNEELCVRFHEKTFTKTDDKTVSKKIYALEHILSENIGEFWKLYEPFTLKIIYVQNS